MIHFRKIVYTFEISISPIYAGFKSTVFYALQKVIKEKAIFGQKNCPIFELLFDRLLNYY